MRCHTGIFGQVVFRGLMIKKVMEPIHVNSPNVAQTASKMRNMKNLGKKIRGYRHLHRSFLLTTSCKREIIDFFFKRTRNFRYRAKM